MEYIFHLIMSSCYSTEGRDVQEIAAVLEEVEDWKTLAGWLNIRKATINNINKNCPSFELAQCTWRELVETYCDGDGGGNPYKTAADIAAILDRKMYKRNQSQQLKRLEFSSEFDWTAIQQITCCDILSLFQEIALARVRSTHPSIFHYLDLHFLQNFYYSYVEFWLSLYLV